MIFPGRKNSYRRQERLSGRQTRGVGVIEPKVTEIRWPEQPRGREKKLSWARLRGSGSHVGRHGRGLDRESSGPGESLGLDVGLL